MSSEPVVLYRDDWLVAISKPTGLAVHRGWAREPDTVAEVDVTTAERVGDRSLESSESHVDVATLEFVEQAADLGIDVAGTGVIPVQQSSSEILADGAGFGNAVPRSELERGVQARHPVARRAAADRSGIAWSPTVLRSPGARGIEPRTHFPR